MFRVWGRTFKSNKMLQSTTIELDIPDETRTHKVFMALEQICEEFDLSNPIWQILTSLNVLREQDFMQTVLWNQ